MNGEETLQLFRSRRSHRAFAPGQVPDANIEKLLEAARWAPSGTNRQPWYIIVVSDPGMITRLADAVKAAGSHVTEPELQAYFKYFDFFRNAPHLAVFGCKRVEGPISTFTDSLRPGLARETNLISVALAVGQFTLQAHTMGLASCLLTGPCIASEFIAKEVSMPESHEILGFCAFGPKPAGAEPQAPNRKDLRRIFRHLKRGDQT